MDLVESETLYSLLKNRYVLLCGDSVMRSSVIEVENKKKIRFSNLEFTKTSFCWFKVKIVC